MKRRDEMSEAEIRSIHQANGFYEVANDLNWDGWLSVAELEERRESMHAGGKSGQESL